MSTPTQGPHQERPETLPEPGESYREVSRGDAPSAAPSQEGGERLIIPGNRETIEEETTRISPEKRPADPKIGPKGLRLQVLFLWLVFIALAITLALTVNIFVGVVTFVLGTLGLLFNPVVGATEKRAEEREIVAEHHRQPEAGEVVVRTTSKRKERRFNRSA